MDHLTNFSRLEDPSDLVPYINFANIISNISIEITLDDGQQQLFESIPQI